MDIGCTYLCIKSLKKSEEKTCSWHMKAMLPCCLIKLILYKNSDSIYLMKYTLNIQNTKRIALRRYPFECIIYFHLQ